MLEFHIKGLTVQFRFTFFAMLTAMLIIDRTGIILFGLLACILHELGHIIAFVIVDHIPELISFESSGIRLVKSQKTISYKQEIFVLIAGSGVNFIFAAVFGLINTKSAAFFCGVHLILGAFNMLPIGTLDGGRIVKLLFLLKVSPSRADFLCNFISVLFFIPLILFSVYLFIVSKNFTLLITTCYLAVMLVIKTGD
jgi:stage IV sporulation protein FB